MKLLNTIKKIIKLPFALLILPALLIAMFVTTDWEDGWDRNYNKTFIKKLIW